MNKALVYYMEYGAMATSPYAIAHLWMDRSMRSAPKLAETVYPQMEGITVVHQTERPDFGVKVDYSVSPRPTPRGPAIYCRMAVECCGDRAMFLAVVYLDDKNSQPVWMVEGE